ncbi:MULTISPECIES: GFA family protein [Rhodanobacter]|uniref:GFA family protein n=1 Tax=Rhodanobacter TaxID=75309 RepID=UPI000400C136|nr:MULTISPECIES: GFA family protein [Rhodanobacter]TAN16845.1 MAG: GFA family protein [Rhodanobacter sp.]UJJ54355.1 GFA family protein [Rhodanobacter thiooxydans]
MNDKGNCHCGKVAFEVESEIGEALACNCSICQRRGSPLWFVLCEKLHLLTPEDATSSYTFNRHAVQHRFCPVCGMHPYAEGTNPKGNAMAAINIRRIEGIELSAIPVRHYDGRAR